jgi:hypothetical protein
MSLLLVVATGCSAPGLYGHEARYAPSYRSYALAEDNGTDDPDRDDESTVVLRDPISERKIRCREELERWMVHYRRKVLDDVHDENWAIASPIIMLPASLVAGLGVDVAAIGIGVAEIPFNIARSEDEHSIYERGVEAFARDDWAEATRLLELGLVKGRRGLSTYYLGIAYANMGRTDDAVYALTAFVERSLVQEVTAYRNAERWLGYLDAPVEPCRSTEPVKIHW